ncbi:MAG: pentapeptide repeat-containing protein [Anaerolineae bacterium]|nr:pentapeptide repeat-containing protein [Anaerolineae bacterium]
MPPDKLTSTFEERLQEAAELRQQNQWLYLIIGVCIGLLLYPLAVQVRADLPAFLSSLVPEGLGLAFTVIILQRYFDHRDAVKERKALLQRLIRRAGSPANNLALDAIAELRTLTLLVGDKGILQGVSLREADLSTANLKDANLRGVDLYQAKLESAILSDADLTGATLRYAKLNHVVCWHTILVNVNLENAEMLNANMRYANLINAKLTGTKLNGAHLDSADLRGANIMGTDLSGADLTGADLTKSLVNLGHAWAPRTLMDAETVLPDGRRYDPLLGHDQIKRYTDPQHPEYVDYSAPVQISLMPLQPFTFHTPFLNLKTMNLDEDVVED